MQRNHVPTRLGQVLDEIETDKARAARDEGGFVSHGLRPLAPAAGPGPKSQTQVTQGLVPTQY